MKLKNNPEQIRAGLNSLSPEQRTDFDLFAAEVRDFIDRCQKKGFYMPGTVTLDKKFINYKTGNLIDALNLFLLSVNSAPESYNHDAVASYRTQMMQLEIEIRNSSPGQQKRFNKKSE